MESDVGRPRQGDGERMGRSRWSQPMRDALLVAIGFGLYLGIVEVAIVGLLSLNWPPQVSPHFVWMAPLADVTLLLLASLPVAAGAALVGGSEARHVRAVVLVCATLVVYSLLRILPGLHWAALWLLSVAVGVEVSRRIARNPAILRRFLHYAIPAVLVIVGIASLLVPGRAYLAERQRKAELGEPDEARPNVLLIILDTVRAKSLGLYGRERRTTPNLERLARRATVFERAYTTAPWTLPSHGTMFTGRYAHELSVDWWLSNRRWAPLGTEDPTLAGVLAREGYLTAGFVANLIYTTRIQGLARGFVHYEDFPVSWGQALLSSSLGRALARSTKLRNLIGNHELVNRKTAATIREDFLTWLDAQERRPFFAFLNLYDAHEPYLPPPPYDRMFGPPVPRERMWRFAGLVGGSGAQRIRKWLNSPEEDQRDLDLYEGAIAYVDAQLGILFEELERRGELGRTVVIITSDHGEQHGEHGLHDHDNSLYVPLLHVPLLVYHPASVPEGASVSEAVTLRDLPATIADLVGLGDTNPFPGTSLRGLWAAPSDSGASSPIVSALEPGHVLQPSYPVANGPMRSLIRDRYHYIRSEGGDEELYDLDDDPQEVRNLAELPGWSSVLEEMCERLDSVLRDHPVAAPSRGEP